MAVHTKKVDRHKVVVEENHTPLLCREAGGLGACRGHFFCGCGPAGAEGKQAWGRPSRLANQTGNMVGWLLNETVAGVKLQGDYSAPAKPAMRKVRNPGMSFTIWFTGLPCSGKTTLSQGLYQFLQQRNYQVHLLDGDAIRATLPRPLSFSKADRDIHGRRLGSLAWSLNKKGVISIVAAIAPYAETREYNRSQLDNYVEVFCRCPVEVAESRDERGLYARARRGQIQNFTGVSDPYEEPQTPEIVVYTDREDIDTSLAKIIIYLEKQGLITQKWQAPRPRKALQKDIAPVS